MSHRTRNRWIWIIGLTVLTGLIVLALRPSPVTVDTAEVSTGPLVVTIDAEGQTRVRDRYTVSTPIPGRLLRPTVRAGDAIHAGDVVAWLEPAPLDARAAEEARARVESAEDARRVAESAVVSARAALAQARRYRVRAESLSAAGLLAPEEREKAELAEITRERELEGADFRAQAAAHDVETARAGLLSASGRSREARFAVRTPVRGLVLKLIEESERVVPAGAPIMEIGDPRRIEVVTDLLSADAVRVQAGDSALIDAWGGEHPLAARVRSIEPSGFTKISALGVEEQRVNAIVDLLDPSDHLGDRFRVEVHAIVWRGDSVVKVPVSALVRRGTEWSVFRNRDGRARQVAVSIGHLGTSEAEVIRGLAPGDLVIVHPSDRVADGVRIRP